MDFRIIVIASSKGGVGKSTVALGVSQKLVSLGANVLLCDLDFGNACLDILLGVEDSIVYTVADGARELCAFEDCVVEVPNVRGLRLMPCPAGGTVTVGDGEGEISPEAIKKTVRSAAEFYECDYVVIDTGAGVNPATKAAAELADTVLVVSGHNPISLRAAEGTVARLSESGCDDIRLVVNSFEAESVLRRVNNRRGLLDIIDSSRAPLAGVVPYDYDLMLRHEGLSGNKKTAKKSHSERAFNNIALRLTGEEAHLFEGMKEIRKKRKKLYR
ncbi:MAG: AAA family ATPase [Clostridia bacterium]|nr:AAA family ATPase [Clostridia bacterium]